MLTIQKLTLKKYQHQKREYCKQSDKEFIEKLKTITILPKKDKRFIEQNNYKKKQMMKNYMVNASQRNEDSSQQNIDWFSYAVAGKVLYDTMTYPKDDAYSFSSPSDSFSSNNDSQNSFE